jgi:aminopeptidase YwaD
MESSAASAPALAEDYERAVLDSLDAFNAGVAPKPQKIRMEGSGAGAVIYRRRNEPRGPLTVFGYDYFADHAKSAGIATPKLLSYEGIVGSGEEYAYEALNFADGRHTAQQIANDLSAEYGPVPLGLVVEYLQALKRIGVVD